MILAIIYSKQLLHIAIKFNYFILINWLNYQILTL